VLRRRHEVTEMYALIEISNKMLKRAVRPLAAGAPLVVGWRAVSHGDMS
jgi:hypothetical protein